MFVLGGPTYYRRFGFDPAVAHGFASTYAGPRLGLQPPAAVPRRSPPARKLASFSLRTGRPLTAGERGPRSTMWVTKRRSGHVRGRGNAVQPALW